MGVVSDESMTAADTRGETMADLLDRLGGIDPQRVRLKPPPGEATEADVDRLRNTTRRLYELVEGTLVEKAMGFRESIVAVAIINLLGSFVKANDLGLVTAPDGMMRLAAGLVRIPDVSYFSWSRFSERRITIDPIPDFAPDLAIEVLSAGNSRREMERKLAEYFAAGVRLAWLIDPATQTAEVYTSPTDVV